MPLTKMYVLKVAEKPASNLGQWIDYKKAKKIKTTKPEMVKLAGTKTVYALFCKVFEEWIGKWRENSMGYGEREFEHMWRVIINPPNGSAHHLMGGPKPVLWVCQNGAEMLNEDDDFFDYDYR